METEQLEQAIEGKISQRTWGRVRQLRVETTYDRVIVHGHTSWYHVKQLTIAAVLETLAALRSSLVADVRIDVLNGD